MGVSLERINDLVENIGIFRPDSGVENLPAPALKGRLNVLQALTRLLKNSGYSFRVEKNGNIIITRSPPQRVADRTQDGRAPWRARSESAGVDSAEVLHESLVKNGPLKNNFSMVEPVQLLSREDIERSGAANVREALQYRLTNRSAQTHGGAIYDTSSFALRGLGPGQTLVLVNGHRLPTFLIGDVPQQSNLDAIPLSAIHHIELWSAADAAAFGGGASSVINVVLRSDVSAVESALFYDTTSDQRSTDRGADFRMGTVWEEQKSSLQFIGHYARGTPLSVAERDYLTRTRQTMAANNPNFYTGGSLPASSAANVRTVGNWDPVSQSISYPLLTTKSGLKAQSFITRVPPGYAGPASDGGASLIANAGNWNLGPAPTAQTNGGGNEPLVNGQRVVSGIATLSREQADGTRIDLEISASDSRALAAANAADSTFILSPSNASNPFEQTIMVTVPGVGADQETESRLASRMFVGTVSRDFGEWKSKAEYIFGATRYRYTAAGGLLDTAHLAVENGGIELLTDPALWTRDFSGLVSEPTRSESARAKLRDFTVCLDGPLWDLPAGAARVHIAVERQDEQLGTASRVAVFNPSAGIGGYHGVNAAFANVRLPLIADAIAPGFPRLELQLGARYDQHVVEASGTLQGPAENETVEVRKNLSVATPIGKINYRLGEDFLLRATYARGALPPSPAQLVPNMVQTISADTAAILGLRDPLRGGEPLGQFALLTGGSPDLEVQRYQSWSIGMTTDPLGLRMWNINVDWEHITETNGISYFPITQANLDSAPAASFLITRAPVVAGDPEGIGRVTEYRGNLVNVTARQIESLDLTLDVNYVTEHYGIFKFSGRTTRMLRNRVRMFSGNPYEDQLGLINSLRWNALGAVTWSRGQWDLEWMTNYFDGYFLNAAHAVNENLGTAKVGRQIYHNVSLGWGMGRSRRSDREDYSRDDRLFSRLDVRLRVSNVLNASAPIGSEWSPHLSLWGDPRGIAYHVSVSFSL
jgi:hypothetical protein